MKIREIRVKKNIKWIKDNSTFKALIVVPLALSAIIPLNYGNMKKMKKELESRN